MAYPSEYELEDCSRLVVALDMAEHSIHDPHTEAFVYSSSPFRMPDGLVLPVFWRVLLGFVSGRTRLSVLLVFFLSF